MKITKPKHLRDRVGSRGGHTTGIADILPYLPNKSCFFDCRHFVYDTIDGILPFALSTRTNANNQQYLLLRYEDSSDNNSR